MSDVNHTGTFNIARAFRRMGARINPFIKVVPDGDCYEVSWFQPRRGIELRDWMTSKGYTTIMSSNCCYVDDVTSEDAMLFKLTFGGDQ